MIANVKAGDALTLTVRVPDGRILINDRQRFDRTRARQFRYVARKRRDLDWPHGRYSARILLQRPEGNESRTIIDLSRELSLD